LISIITVVFNCEKYLEQTIESILSQDWENVEYIIVDGASKDGTIDIIRKYEDQIDYWVSEPDKGISDAFSKGIGLATGEIIGLVNGDDWLEAGALKEVATQFMDSTTDRNSTTDKDTLPEILCGALQYWRNEEKDFVFYSNLEPLKNEMTVNHPATFVKASVYEKFGAFDSTYRVAMDYEFLLRCLVGGARFATTERILSNMRLDGNSDILWIESFADVRRAKIHYGRSPVSAWLYFFFQIIRKLSSRLLSFIGLSGLVKLFRRYFSVMTKEQ
jgi:glycosyltransferase involved in cell wall biosynthesis